MLIYNKYNILSLKNIIIILKHNKITIIQLIKREKNNKL